MELTEAILNRHSIRGFTGKPVPKETLRKVLYLAERSVSTVNAQPWEFWVVTGEALERIRQANLEDFRSGRATDYKTVVPEGTCYKERARAIGKSLFEAMEITREDREKRKQWYERGYRFFDAPAVIILMMDKILDEAAFRLDMGCVTQTICYAAMEFGLGTCVQDQAVAYQRGLREILHLPDNLRPVVGIAIGYPDPEFPANHVASTRETLDDVCRWF